MLSPAAVLWLIFLFWLPALVDAKVLQLESCQAERIILQPWLQVYEDVHGGYMLDDFLEASSAELDSMNLPHPVPHWWKM